MRLNFYTIPIVHPQAADAELNQFLATHRVSRVEKVFVPDGAASAWSVVVTWLDGADAAAAPPGANAATPRAKDIDYKTVLSPPEFAVYDRLRTLRKELAQAEGLPTYAVFTNEQLAALVQGRVTTEPGLMAVEGLVRAPGSGRPEPMRVVVA